MAAENSRSWLGVVGALVTLGSIGLAVYSCIAPTLREAEIQAAKEKRQADNDRLSEEAIKKPDDAANGGGTIYPEASYTVYRNAGATGAETTTYAYPNWYSNGGAATGQAGSPNRVGRSKQLPISSCMDWCRCRTI